MVKPLSTDEFLRDYFREQQERMEISDEDWEEYEERMHQQKIKRKRVNPDKSSARAKPDASTDQLGNGLHKSETPFKKRKLSQSTEAGPFISSDSVRSSSPSPLPQAKSSPPGITTSLNPSEATVESSSKPHKHTPTPPVAILFNVSSPSSNVTSPEVSCLEASATTSALAPPEDASDSSNVASSETRVRNTRRSKSLQHPPAQNTSRKITSDEKQRAQVERLAKKTAQQVKREAEKLKTAQDEKEARMTPLEYAAILQEKWKSRVANTPSEKLFLTDNVIFLIFEEQNKSQKDTRIKLDIIARHGGKVATRYDPSEVTHIIPASTSITLKKTLRALGVKSLSNIPSNIKTVKWDWIVSGLSKRIPDSEVMHELFKQRMAYMYPSRSISDENARVKGKDKEKVREITTEHSVIEDFNSVYDSPNEEDDSVVPTHPGGSGVPGEFKSAVKDEPEDPLLPFYAKAREEAEAEEPDDEATPQPEFQANQKTQKYKGFQCDKKGTHVEGASPNWDIIEKLAELRELHRENGTQDDVWRVIGYQKAIGSLKAHPTRIKSREEAMKLAGVSDKTADKIMEIIKTGELRRIGYTKTEDLNAMRIFNGIYGVGSNTARKWYNEGFKTLTDLRRAVQDGQLKLSTAQEIGLNFYDDINDRMPRAEAQEIFDKIKPIALGLDPKLSMEIMGSFRRGKKTCGDIDILLTRPTDDGCTHAGILPRFCNLLHKQGILTEDLATPDEWGALEATYRGICRRDATSRRRRIDILCIPYECRGAARIYYTGDDIFNRSIRLKANKMNMSLNQRGLFEGVVRDPQDRRKKLCTGSLLCSHSEKKIFEILGVPWQEPHERVRSG